jgi:hypothetical protein
MFPDDHLTSAFPIHVEDRKHDYMLLGEKCCKRYNEVLVGMFAKGLRMRHPMSPYMVRELEALDPDTDAYAQIRDVVDNIRSAEFHGIPHPYTEKFSEDAVIYSDGIWNATLYSNLELTRVDASRFFKDVEEKMFDVLYNNSTLKLALYSAHDMTIATFLTALELWDGRLPPYASSVRFELSVEDTIHYVRVLYNDKDLRLPSCPTHPCKYHEFRRYLLSKVISS